MRSYDLSPLYRSAIGFDRMANLINSVNRSESRQTNYPPYNIKSFSEDEYRITLAVAGFSQDEIEVELEQNLLTVKGSKSNSEETGEYLHQCIAARNFERKFQLDDYVTVVDASSRDGLLHINLVREIPEAMKPRTIKVKQTDKSLYNGTKDSSVSDLSKSAA